MLGIENYLGHGSAMDNQIAFKKHIDYLGVKNVEVNVDYFLTHSFPDDSMDIVCASDVASPILLKKESKPLQRGVFFQLSKYFGGKYIVF